MRLLTIDNAKTPKGLTKGYLTGILYLAPHKIADGARSLCPYSTPGCRKACLYTAGRGAFSKTKEARIIKTQHLIGNPEGFIEQLLLDIEALERKAKKKGLIPVVRLNGTSDIRWEIVAPQLFTNFPRVQFYDYSKYPWHLRKKHEMPLNYHLTYSVSEDSTKLNILETLANGCNVALVGDPNALWFYFDRKRLVNGDEHDLRFLDAPGSIVQLKAKGRAKKDQSGFVFKISERNAANETKNNSI